MMPSLFYRLTDPDSLPAGTHTGYDVQQMIDAVRFDLEDLFNTRQSVIQVPKQYTELQNSILTYGIPDLTFFNINNKSQCQTICGMLVTLINRFEPRLRNVRATVVKGEGTADGQVRFHFEGQLAVDPAPEVGFDTIVELSSGKTSVKAESIV
jgi:type VI secretion system protein ImpF